VERWLLLHVPTAVLGLLFVVVAVGASLAALGIVRRTTRGWAIEPSNDVAGFIISLVGVLYGVLLAFVVVAVWERFDEANGAADHEAETVLALYRDASAFADDAPGVRGALAGYARSVVVDEWPVMASSQEDHELTDAAMADVFRAYRGVTLSDPREELFLEGSLNRLDELTEARRARVFASVSHVAAPMWTLVLAGAAITIGFACFFTVPSFGAHCAMVSAVAVLIGLTLFLIVSLDYPFTGDLAVGADAMQDAIREFVHLDATR
jgi:hypothetical protein